MSEGARPRLHGVVPLLQVFDMIEAARFYRDLLDFEVVQAAPEVETSEGRFSPWMWLRRGAAEVMLNTAYDSNERPPARDDARWRGHGDVTLFIGCDDVDAVWQALKARGLPAEAPTLAPYGLKRFNLIDPDGYGVCFQGAA